MSGGSMNYAYLAIQNIEFPQTTLERKAFAVHLRKVAKALHDIEWVDSRDYREGEESEAILACLGDGALLDAAITTTIAAQHLNQLNAVPGEPMTFVFNTLPIEDNDLGRVKWGFVWAMIYVVHQREIDRLAMTGCLDSGLL